MFDDAREWKTGQSTSASANATTPADSDVSRETVTFD